LRTFGVLPANLVSEVAAGYVNSGQRVYRGRGNPLYLFQAAKSRLPGTAEGLATGAEVPLASVNGRLFGVCGWLADGYHSRRFLGVGSSW